MDTPIMTLNDLIQDRKEQSNKDTEKEKIMNGLCSGLFLLCSNALLDVGFVDIEDFLMNEFRDYLANESRFSKEACHTTARAIDDLFVRRSTYDEVVAKNDEYGKALARGDRSIDVDLGDGKKARLNIQPLTREDEIAAMTRTKTS